MEQFGELNWKKRSVFSWFWLAYQESGWPEEPHWKEESLESMAEGRGSNSTTQLVCVALEPHRYRGSSKAERGVGWGFAFFIYTILNSLESLLLWHDHDPPMWIYNWQFSMKKWIIKFLPRWTEVKWKQRSLLPEQFRFLLLQFVWNNKQMVPKRASQCMYNPLGTPCKISYLLEWHNWNG